MLPSPGLLMSTGAPDARARRYTLKYALVLVPSRLVALETNTTDVPAALMTAEKDGWSAAAVVSPALDTSAVVLATTSRTKTSLLTPPWVPAMLLALEAKATRPLSDTE